MESIIQTALKQDEEEKKEQAIFEDATDCLMNLIALEKHLLETALKTKRQTVLVMADMARENRQKFMQLIFKEGKQGDQTARSSGGEFHCAVKHALMARMNLFEVAQKYSSQGKYDEAFECLEQADDVFAFLSNAYEEMRNGFLTKAKGNG